VMDMPRFVSCAVLDPFTTQFTFHRASEEATIASQEKARRTYPVAPFMNG
jgi:hypothetical protein